MTHWMKRSLEPLFDPKAVAVIGASAVPGKIGNMALRSLMAGNRDVFPVNPHEREILGLTCYPSISDVPSGVDVALVALPSRMSLDSVRECATNGVKFVILASSGFRESGDEGAELEARLLEAVSGTQTRILGPNTMGLYVPSNHLDTLFVTPDRSRRPGPGSVAIISQSGAVAVSFLEKAEHAGLGISACVCLGNRCDIDELEVMDHLMHDESTKCIAMYLESFSDGREFVSRAGEASSRKPIVMLKAGRTSAGSRAARSHTGAISSSSDAVVEGAIRQAGVVRAYDEEELVDLSMSLAAVGRIHGGRVCVVASAGGFGVIAADLVESGSGLGPLSMAQLGDPTKRELEKVMPAFTSPSNPVDLTAGVTDDTYAKVLDILQRDPGIDVILMSLELQPPGVSERLVQIAAERASHGGTPIVVSVFAKDQSEALRRVVDLGAVAYPTIKRSVRSIAALAERGRYLKRFA